MVHRCLEALRELLKERSRLATNDFLGRGGDGYDMFTGAPRLIDAAAGKLMAALVIEAIAAAGEIAPRIEGRIVRLD